MIWAKFWISQTRASALGHATNAPHRVQITEEPSCSENHPKKPLHWSWSCSLMFILCSILVVQSCPINILWRFATIDPSKAELANNFPCLQGLLEHCFVAPWQTWHFESLNHLTRIQTSQTLCLKDLAPKFKKNKYEQFCTFKSIELPILEGNLVKLWRGRSVSATSTETNVCSGLSAKMPPRSRMARQICEEKIVYDIFG